METFPQPFRLPFPVDKNALARFPVWEETRKGVWGKRAEQHYGEVQQTWEIAQGKSSLKNPWKCFGGVRNSLGNSPCPAAQLFQGYFKHYYSRIPVPEYIFYK